MIADVYHVDELEFLRQKGTLGLMRHIAQHEGLAALYRGLSASLLGISHVVIQLPLYEWLKASATTRRQELDTLAGASQPGSEAAAVMATTPLAKLLHLWDVVAASTISKVVASSITYPHEVVRARMQDSRTPTTLAKTAKEILSAEGARGFYQGIGVNLVRVLPSTVVTFVAYEWFVGLIFDRGGQES